MINSTITTINSYLQGFDKLYCLLERREKKTVEYSGGGSYGSIPFDNYAVGGYWRMRSAVTIAESEGTVACTKKQVMTYPLYFVAWFNRDHVSETIDEFAQNTMALISGLRTPSVKTKVLGYDTEKQKEESGQLSNTWVMLRFNVDVIYTKNCPTTCVTPAVDDCILNGSINDVAIGQFFEDFNIIVQNDLGDEVGTWDEENSIWVVPSCDPCEVISEATAQEIVDCLDPRQLEPLQELICEPPVCNPLSYRLVNTAEPPVEIVNGLVNDPCGQSLTIEVPTVQYYDCNNELQTVPFPWPQAPVNEQCVCDPAIVTLEGIQIASITDPCGSLTELTCETVTNAVLVSGAGSDVNGLYTLGAGNVNDKIWWENITTDTVIVWNGVSQWQLLNSEETTRYYVDGDSEVWPWLGTWIVSEGEEPAPTVTQATVGDICPCDPCLTLCELIDDATAADIVDCIGDAGKTSAVQALICTPCADVTIEVAGTPVDDYSGGTTVDITISEEGGTVSPLGVTQPTADTIDIKVRWRCTPLTDHITLDGLNPFGNNKRFTGTTGGYKVGASYFNADGSGTIEATAFPNDIVIDWSVSHYDSVIAVSRVINAPLVTGSIATQDANLVTLNSGAGFAGHTDWTRVPKQILSGLTNEALQPAAMDFDPFNYNGALTVYAKEVSTGTPTNNWYLFSGSGAVTQAVNTTNRAARIYRIYTFSELGL